MLLNVVSGVVLSHAGPAWRNRSHSGVDSHPWQDNHLKKQPAHEHGNSDHLNHVESSVQ